MVSLATRLQVSRPAKLLALLSLLLLLWLLHAYRRAPEQHTLATPSQQLELPNRVGEGEAKEPPKRIRVDVYYECLCPDSRYFLLQHLVPAFNKLGSALDIRLWPYGKAETSENPMGGYSFSCQHGDRECEGNTYHTCAAHLLRDQAEFMPLVACMIDDNMQPQRAAHQCLESVGSGLLQWERLRHCAEPGAAQGQHLLAEAGKRTHALVPKVSFIPTIEIEGSQRDQKKILKNFLGEVCKVYEAKFKGQLDACS